MTFPRNQTMMSKGATAAAGSAASSLCDAWPSGAAAAAAGGGKGASHPRAAAVAGPSSNVMCVPISAIHHRQAQTHHSGAMDALSWPCVGCFEMGGCAPEQQHSWHGSNPAHPSACSTEQQQPVTQRTPHSSLLSSAGARALPTRCYWKGFVHAKWCAEDLPIEPEHRC
jgi:hypothetical protein